MPVELVARAWVTLQEICVRVCKISHPASAALYKGDAPGADSVCG